MSDSNASKDVDLETDEHGPGAPRAPGPSARRGGKQFVLTLHGAKKTHKGLIKTKNKQHEIIWEVKVLTPPPPQEPPSPKSPK